MSVKKLRYHIHRYRCTCCGETFTENIPDRYPGTRITRRAAQWILTFLLHNLTVSSIQQIMGIHWDTIRRIQETYMREMVERSDRELKESGKKPRFLAVDEFAIHKGHRYATCVLDLENGHVLWAGKGRAKADFRHFFKEIDMDYLSDVKAIAMDMIASYNLLVQEYLPNVDIVYDRYHMQAQYGKDVLGVVRLEAARAHKAKASELKEMQADIQDPREKARLKAELNEEKGWYQRTKNSRWDFLRNNDTLPEYRKEPLDQILKKHEELAVCYAMKEEMREIFELKDKELAATRWERWFEVAQKSSIEPLRAFAERKAKRIQGLIAHAVYPISTGPLEGLNNKIKVAKRIAYVRLAPQNHFSKIFREVTGETPAKYRKSHR